MLILAPTRFNTARLAAERLTQNNAIDFIAMEHNAEVMRTLGGVQPEDAIRTKIVRNIEHWNQHGFGIWMFHDKAGNFVGRGGLRYLEIEGTDHIEIAYALMSEYWRKGFACEMTDKFIDIAKKIGLPELIAVTTPDNFASRRVMEKSGLYYDRDCIHSTTPCVLYRLSL